MNGDERYLFDLQGYLVVEDALDANQLTALNKILDRRIADEVAAEDHTHRFLDLLECGVSRTRNWSTTRASLTTWRN